MSKIMKIFKRDLKMIRKNIIAIIIVLGVAILPSLYAWVNILASWNPYSNTSTIPVAVVNLDEATIVNGQVLNVGDDVIEQLKSNHNINWQFVSEDEADAGLTTAKYYAIIEITNDFSKDLASIITDDPVKPTIIYKVNTKENPVLSKITTIATETLTSEIKTNFLQTVNQTVFSSLTEVNSKIKDNEKELIVAKHTIININDNLNYIIAMLNASSATSENIEVYLSSLQASIPALQTSLDNLQAAKETENQQAVSNQATLLSTLDSFSTSLNDLSATNQETTALLNEYLKQANDNFESEQENYNTIIKSNLESSYDTVNKLIIVLTSLNDSLDTPNQELTTEITNLQNLADSLQAQTDNVDSYTKALGDDAEELTKKTIAINDENAEITSEMNTAIKGYNDNLKTDLNDLFSNYYQINSDTQDLIAKLYGVTDTVSSVLTTSIAQADLSNDISTDVTTNLLYFKEILNDLVNILDDVDDDEISETIAILETDPEVLADYLTNPFEIVDKAIYPVDNYGSGMAPIYSSLAMWVGAVILTSIFSTEVKSKDFQDYTIKEKYLGKFIFFGFMAILQGLILMLGNMFLLQVQVANAFVFIVLGAYCSLIFSIIVYTNVSLFGNIGKAFNVILLVMQIAGCGGAYPIQVDPLIFRIMQPFFPFTYSLGLIREAIAGVLVTAVVYDVVIITIIGAFYLILGYFYKEKIYHLNQKFEEKLEESHIAE